MDWFQNGRDLRHESVNLWSKSFILMFFCVDKSIMPKALDISKNTPLTSTGELQSKDEYMSCTIESSRYSQEPEGQKPG